MIRFMKYFSFFAILLQLFPFNASSIFPNPGKLNTASINSVLQTMVPIFKMYGSNHGVFLGNGVLVHQQAVLSSRACVRDFSAHSYAIGLYKWENNQATINRTKLYSVEYFLNIYIFFGYLKTDKSLPNKQADTHEYVNIETPILLVLKNRIQFMHPANFGHALNSKDIYDSKVPKKCYRLEMPPRFSTRSSSNNSKLTYVLLPETQVFNHSEVNAIYNNTVFKKYINDKQNSNTSLTYVSHDSVFVTNPYTTNSNESFKSPGSPLICQNLEDDTFTLTGILIDTLDRFPMYFAVNGELIKKKLSFLNSLR